MTIIRSAWFTAILVVSEMILTAKTHRTPELNKPSARNRSGCWIYTHLQKCGGSTIKTIVRESWGSRFTVYDSKLWKRGDDFMQEFAQRLTEGNQWAVLSGGYPEALRRSPAVRGKCEWFTLFRHPVARMVSAFYYCKAVPGDIACASKVLNANNADILTFAKHWGNFALRQFALSLVPSDDVMAFALTEAAKAKLPWITDLRTVPGWYLLKMYHEEQATLAGSTDEPDLALQGMLQPVQDLLRDEYVAVGILEEFNTTLSLFHAALNMPGVDWRKQYHDHGKIRVDRKFESEKRDTMQEAWTNSEIAKYMRLDLLLYDHAVRVFHQQVDSYSLR